MTWCASIRTLGRTDLDALIDAAENAADIASVRAWHAYVAAVGRDAAIANLYTPRKRSACSRARVLFESGVRSTA